MEWPLLVNRISILHNFFLWVFFVVVVVHSFVYFEALHWKWSYDIARSMSKQFQKDGLVFYSPRRAHLS